MTRKTVAGIIMMIAVLVLFTFLFPHASEAAKITPPHTGKDVKGITFEEFWGKAREEVAKWGGPALRVRRILSLNVIGFDGRNGRSPGWEAQFVRCDKPQYAMSDEENQGKICKGRTITVRMVEAGVTGTTTGLQVLKEIHYRGPSIPVERITVSPQKAEDTANSHRQYSSVETDAYSYDLRYDQRKDKAVWVIKRTCGYKGKAEGRCIPGDYWIVKVDAASGEVIKPEKNSKSRTKKQEEED
jgi:hypothetical protein